MRRRRWLWLVLSFVSVQSAAAQEDRLIPRGAHSFHVYGTGEGSDMPPWVSQISVRDTTIANQNAVVIAAGSRLDGGTWRFTTRTTFSGLPPAEMHVVSAGRSRAGDHGCEARVRNGWIEVATSPPNAPVKAGPFEIPILPEIAAAYIIAAMPLRNDMKIVARMFRCEDAHASDPIRSWDVHAVVATGMHARVPGATPEPVWIVTGDANMPYRATIAKSDRMVLRYELPQGAMGSMVSEYRGTR
jgi:hypothetical protein